MKQAERTEQTRRKIKEAFVSLIEDKGFDTLTVSDITRRATISRGTFYVHYTDKHQLLASIENEIKEQISSIIEANIKDTLVAHSELHQGIDEADEDLATEMYNLFIKALDYINDERRTLKVLMSPQGHPQFFMILKEVVTKLVLNHLQSSSGNYTTAIPADYAREMMVDSIVYLVRYWIDKDNPEPPAGFAEILMNSRFLAPNDLLIFHK